MQSFEMYSNLGEFPICLRWKEVPPFGAIFILVLPLGATFLKLASPSVVLQFVYVYFWHRLLWTIEHLVKEGAREIFKWSYPAAQLLQSPCIIRQADEQQVPPFLIECAGTLKPVRWQGGNDLIVPRSSLSLSRLPFWRQRCILNNRVARFVAGCASIGDALLHH